MRDIRTSTLSRRRARHWASCLAILVGVSGCAHAPVPAPVPPTAARQASPVREQAKVIRLAAWTALENADYERVLELTQECLDTYAEEGRRMQESLDDFPWGPTMADIQQWAPLNAAGECLLIRGMAFQRTSRPQQAAAAYQRIIDEFLFSQNTDDCLTWKPAEAARQYLDEMGE